MKRLDKSTVWVLFLIIESIFFAVYYFGEVDIFLFLAILLGIAFIVNRCLSLLEKLKEADEDDADEKENALDIEAEKTIRRLRKENTKLRYDRNSLKRQNEKLIKDKYSTSHTHNPRIKPQKISKSLLYIAVITLSAFGFIFLVSLANGRLFNISADEFSKIIVALALVMPLTIAILVGAIRVIPVRS